MALQNLHQIVTDTGDEIHLNLVDDGDVIRALLTVFDVDGNPAPTVSLTVQELLDLAEAAVRGVRPMREAA